MHFILRFLTLGGTCFGRGGNCVAGEASFPELPPAPDGEAFGKGGAAAPLWMDMASKALELRPL